jgi:hypothetical protein
MDEARTAIDHLTVGGTCVHYKPGTTLEEVGGESGDFVAVRAKLSI